MLSPIALRLALMTDARRWTPRASVSAPIVGSRVDLDVYSDETAPATLRSACEVSK